MLVDSELREVLRNFMNACLMQGRIPKLWEAGEIVALYKKKDPRLPANYRPITLLDTLHKIMLLLTS